MGNDDNADRIHSLLICARAVLQSPDFETAARVIYNEVKALIGATAGYTALLSADGTENEVLFLDAGGSDCTVDPALPMPIRGLREKAYATGAAVYDNAFARSPWMAFMPPGHAPLANVLFAPLVIAGQARGLIGLANKPGGFTEADARLAELIGEVGAIALQHHHDRNQLIAANTGLAQRVQDKTRALAEANTRLIEEIAEHRRAVAALTQSEARYRLIADNATDMISRHRPDGIYLYASPACKALLGYGSGELIGHNAYEFFHPADLDAIRRSHTNALETRQTSTVAYRMRRRDGSFLWVETTSRSIRDPQTGQMLEITATTRDISERKAYEDQLFASRQTQRALLDASTETAVLIDREAVILAINETGARRLNGSPRDLVGRCALDLLPPEIAARRKTILDGVFQSGKPLVFQDQRYGRHMEHSLQPIFGPDGRVERLAIFARDITRQLEMEASLRSSEARYRHLIENAPVSIGMLDGGRFVCLNPASRALLALAEDGREAAVAVEQVIDPAHWPMIADRMKRTAKGQHNPPMVLKLNRRDDKTVYVESTSFPAQIDGKTVTLIFGRDITEQKAAEDQLRANARIARARLSLMQYAADHDLDQVLQQTLDQVGALTDSPIGFFHFVNPDDGTIALQAWSSATLREFCAARGKGLHYDLDKAGIWADAIRHRRPVIHNDYGAEAGRKGMPPGHAAVVREAVVPVIRADRVVAVLGVGNKPRTYDQNDVEQVARFADLAWDIAEGKKAQAELQASRSRLQALTSLLLDAQEKERSRISRELHDQLGQDLMVLKLQVQSMTTDKDHRPCIDAPVLVRSIDQITDNLRRLARDLSPAVLEDLGLAPALRWQINELARHAGLKATVRYGLFEKLVARDREILVYRIVQEAMTNIVRHAGASKVSITLRENGGGRQLAIRDNGKGFDLAEVAAKDPARRGLGMAAMDERARMLGGALRIESAPGKGTVVFLELPEYTPKGGG